MNRLNIKLVEQAIIGDKEAFSELVDCYKNTVYSLAFSHVRNTADAEDLTQDVFLQAFEGLHTLKDTSKFLQWLRGIAINKCKMWKRGRRETCSYDASESEEEVEGEVKVPSFYAPSFEEDLERRELWEEIFSSVLALPSKYRIVVLLYYFDEMPQKEIAEFMDISVTAVETRLQRARQLLKKELIDVLEGKTNRQSLKDGMRIKKFQRVTVNQSICEQIDVSPDDTVVIYYDLRGTDSQRWYPVRIQGTEKNPLQVKGRKVLIGENEDEAIKRLEQIQVLVERRSDFFEKGPLNSETWVGVKKKADKAGLVYIPTTEWWKNLKTIWKETDEELFAFLQETLGREVITVVAAGNRVDPILMPSEILPRCFFFPTWGDLDESLGPAGNAELMISIPPCRNVIFIGLGSLSFSHLKANLFFLSNGALFFSGEDISGDVHILNAFPIKLVQVSGDVIQKCSLYQLGMREEDRTIYRIRIPSQTDVRQIEGSLRISCKNLNLNISEIKGDIFVENSFGDTNLFLTGDYREDSQWEIRSISGSINVKLSEEFAKKLKVAMWTGCGAINYKKWQETVFCSSEPYSIYAGSDKRSEEANLRIRTESGTIIIEKE